MRNTETDLLLLLLNDKEETEAFYCLYFIKLKLKGESQLLDFSKPITYTLLFIHRASFPWGWSLYKHLLPPSG